MSDILNFLGNLVSGGAQAGASVYQANKNYESQQQTNAMTIDLANTAVQRRQADLAAAGINPLLAGTQGGAQTPTLQAPQMQGLPEAARSATQPLTQQYQQAMRLQEAQTQQLNATTNKTNEEARLAAAQADIYSKEAQSRIGLQGAQTEKTTAETATSQALRDPTVNKLVADAAQTAQQTQTEQQKTIQEKAAAQNADKLFGAKASEAVTLANQAADEYLRYFDKNHQLNIESKTLANELLTQDNTAKALDIIIKNDYGRGQAISSLDFGKLLGPALLHNSSTANFMKIDPHLNYQEPKPKTKLPSLAELNRQ